jgi:hypothetical protein
MKALTAFTLAHAILALAACGGGGGGGSSKAPAPSIAISAANAERVAQATVAATNVNDSVGVGDDFTGDVNQATTASASAAKRVAKILRTRAQPQIQVSDSVPCDQPSSGPTGNISFTVNDADNNGDLSRNDTIEATLSNCFLNDAAATSSGKISVRVTSLGTNSAGLAMQFTNLAVDSLGGSDFTLNGSIDALATAPTATTSQLVLTGGSLTARDAKDSITLSATNLTFTHDQVSNRYTTFGGATITSGALGGTVAFNIPSSTPLTGLGEANPDGGSFTVSGKDSNLVVTVLGGNNVGLAIDNTGDNVADESRTVTWDQILI